MSVKEELHRLVDTLSEEEAERALASLRQLPSFGPKWALPRKL